MNNFINCAKKLILVKDMSSYIDFDLINQKFNELEFVENLENSISTDKRFFENDLFLEARQTLETECKNFILNAYGTTDFTDLKITESWGNITSPHDSHHTHSHPFSVVSGVIFLDEHPENFNLHLEYNLEEIPYFIPFQQCYMPVSKLIESTGEDLSTTNNLKNHMVLFLSSTVHYVTPVTTSTNRRTIAFNTFWSGVTGVKHAALGSIKF